MHLTGNKYSPKNLLLFKYKQCSARMEDFNYCNVSSWRNTLIILTHTDETKKRAHDSQIVRAKENLKYFFQFSLKLFFSWLKAKLVNTTRNTHI